MAEEKSPPPGTCGISSVSWSNQFVATEATITGRNLYANASENDVRTRIRPRAEGADERTNSPPPLPDPGGDKAKLVISKTGIQIVARLAHAPKLYPGQIVELNVRCGDGRGWTGWRQIT